MFRFVVLIVLATLLAMPEAEAGPWGFFGRGNGGSAGSYGGYGSYGSTGYGSQGRLGIIGRHRARVNARVAARQAYGSTYGSTSYHSVDVKETHSSTPAACPNCPVESEAAAETVPVETLEQEPAANYPPQSAVKQNALTSERGLRLAYK